MTMIGRYNQVAIELDKKTLITVLTTSLCMLFFIAMNIQGESYKLAPFGLLTLSLALVLLNRLSFSSLKPFTWLVTGLFVYFLAYVISFIYHDESASVLDMPSRAVFAVLVLMTLIKYPPNLQAILWAIPIGGILTGLVALYFQVAFETRAFYGHGFMVIQSSGMAAWVSCLSFVVAGFALEQLKYQDSVLTCSTKTLKYLLAVACLGGVMALTASLLSGGRGAWVATPFILLGIAFLYRSIFTKKVILGVTIAISITGTLGYPQIQPRIQTMVKELQLYNTGNIKINNSSGARLTLWHGAYLSFLERPILGVGSSGRQADKERQVEAKLINPAILRHNGAHNQYLEMLQTKGLVGLTAIMFMFSTSSWFFITKLRKAVSTKKPQVKLVAILGLVHVASIMGYCLTQNYLNHHSGILLYVLGLVIISSLFTVINNENRIQKVD
nr:hypothetical protein BCU42_05675 [Vibrio splendidus]